MEVIYTENKVRAKKAAPTKENIKKIIEAMSLNALEVAITLGQKNPPEDRDENTQRLIDDQNKEYAVLQEVLRIMTDKKYFHSMYDLYLEDKYAKY